jgi:potassium channel subfamily K protein 5
VIVFVGAIVFLVMPSFILMKIEKWRFLDSLYFTFVTLFTIGFGDFVAGGQTTYNMSKNWLIVYRIILYCWMFLGMAYISLIITYVLDNFKNILEIHHIKNDFISALEEKVVFFQYKNKP